MIEKVTSYKTSDGKIFNSLKEAEKHEKTCYKNFVVTYYFDGAVSIEVQARDEYEAIEIAENKIVYDWNDVDIDEQVEEIK